MTSLLAQKKDIKRQNILLERMRAESEAELAAARVAARERVLREFESTQTALGGSKNTANGVSGTSSANDSESSRGLKRKYELDEDEVDRLAQVETEKALTKITAEAAESRKAKLPNFWLVRFQRWSPLVPTVTDTTSQQPSLTPSASPDAVLDVKLQTLCQVSKPAHPIR